VLVSPSSHSTGYVNRKRLELFHKTRTWLNVGVRFPLRQVTALGLALVLIATLSTLTSCGSKKPATAEEQFAALPLITALLKEGKPLFVSLDFLASIPKKEAALTPTREESLAAVQDPTSFYRLQRGKHFSAILLSPYPGSMKLADSLLSSPLWTLSDVSPVGYLFRPIGSAPWQLPKSESLEKIHPDPSERAAWLISTAANLIPLGKRDEAEQLLVMAATTRKQPSLLLSTRASLAASRGQWNEAMILAKESLGKDSGNAAARTIQVRALIECSRGDEALEQARRLVEIIPNQESLFLLARAANASNDQEEEISSLKRLVALGAKEHQPLGASLTYLGQAYAKNGERGEALRTFQKAIAAPELTDEQRKMIKELMDHIALEKH